MLAVAALAAAGVAVAPVGGSQAATELTAGLGDCVQDDAWPAARQDYADQVVALVNEHRASLGLVPLQVSPALTAAAVWKARHMTYYGYLAHDDPAPPVDRSWFQRLQACGYPSWGVGGENIALGYETPEAVVKGWLGSPGHAANIENPSFRAIGVGVARAPIIDGYLFWAQDFGTIDDSGSPVADTTAPSAPGLLTATARSSSQVSLTWGPSTDNVGVTGYRVYRNGAQVGTTTATSYVDEGLTAGSAYSYTVRAYDAAGNPGPPSGAVTVTIPLPPPIAGAVYASSTWIESGFAAGGFPFALRTEDRSTLDVASELGSVSWYGRFNVQRGVTGLFVAYAGGSTQPCARTLAVYDWTNGVWQPVDTGEAKASTTVAVPGPVARFLGGSSIMGVVRARVSCARADGMPFTLATDRLALLAA